MPGYSRSLVASVRPVGVSKHRANPAPRLEPGAGLASFLNSGVSVAKAEGCKGCDRGR
jgi:hypothetical protein